MRFTNQDRIELLKIARNTIEASLNNVKYYPSSQTKILQAHCGAFVTLHKNGMLKGCIGRFNVDYELYKVVHDVTLQSAFEDDRFSPVRIEEMNEIDIEISVLTPFRRITDINEIELGRHGIFITKYGRSGTFLPQVATETGWTLMEFLGHCTQDKMGLGWNDWKDADIFTYEAEVFGEKELGLK
jgi:AmmeMemoRadiSam system protein A